MNTAIKNNIDVMEFYSTDNIKVRLNFGDIQQNAINLAYRDLKRTLRGFNKNSEKDLIKKEISSLIKAEYEKLFLSSIDIDKC